MAPRKSAKKAVAKQEETPSPEEFFDASKRIIPSQETTKSWPDRIVEKHSQRHAAIMQEMKNRRDFKQQRLIDNGVPAEKRSL